MYQVCKKNGETIQGGTLFKGVGGHKISLQGVDSLWGDCTFIPCRLGIIVVDLCYFAQFEDFSL
jgi:hypothetical protein